MNEFLISHSYWILIFPFVSFLVNGLFLCRNHRKAAGALSVSLSGLSMLYAVALVASYFLSAAPEKIVAWKFTFFSLSDKLTADAAFLLDPLSAMMLFVIAVISFFVNIYSLGYMREDRAEGRFFSLLSFFTFSMLGLVVATGLFQMYFFWELVGIASYLLIGFWYERPKAVAASKMAFIVTRFADSFFLLGIVIVCVVAGTFDFGTLNSINPQMTSGSVSLGFWDVKISDALILGSVLMFIGGWGKSAMFPLHIWLPNAMEGPTPVSSIIHSATMVVAGVYLVARLFPFFSACDGTLEIVGFVGAFTALFAAVIACTQKDIKRILAYSTLSQLGYMMFGLGVSATAAASFHVFNHAFFKCMLFLVAGSLIHQVSTNDLDQMGGLRKKMPWTYFAALIACLSISGIPPFSGFFSKDEILSGALQNGHPVIFAVGLFTSALTAFYMFRLFFLAFHGSPRSEAVKAGHVHEDFAMTLPIVCLAIPSLASGFLCKGMFEKFLGAETVSLAGETSSCIPIIASAAGILGIAIAWILYASPKANVSRALDSTNRGTLYRTVYNKFYFDEGYYAFVRQFVFGGIARTARAFEDFVIGKIVTGTTCLIKFGGTLVRELETGNIFIYIGTFIVGVILWRYLGGLPV